MSERPPSTLLFREIAIADAAAAAELSGQLGYLASPQVMAERIAQLQRWPHHAIFVACLAETVVGWVDLVIAQHLQGEPYCEIGGLVVAASVRSMGIGRQLVARAEQWAKAQGVTNMLVRSRITRQAAHRFYLREGYVHSKTSAVFSKQLS